MNDSLTTTDDFLGGLVRLRQRKNGYRATSDAVLLAAAVTARTGDTILDAGAGTGAVSLCLNARIAGLNITGIDIQQEMIDAFNDNIVLNRAQNNITAVKGDIRDKNNGVAHGAFDCVVTNPPFTDEDCVSPYAFKDIAHRQSSCSLSDWIDACLKYAGPKGRFFMINRADRLPEILSLLFSRLGGITVTPVFTKEGNPAKRVIVSGTKGSKAAATLSRGVTLNDANGMRTPVAEDIMRFGKSL